MVGVDRLGAEMQVCVPSRPRQAAGALERIIGLAPDDALCRVPERFVPPGVRRLGGRLRH